MTYDIDPELRAALPDLPTIDLADYLTARATLGAAVAQAPPYELPANLSIRDQFVPGPPGGPEVLVRIYNPRRAERPLPCLVNIHGGGFVLGSIDTDHAAASVIAAAVQIVVVAVDYRLAPEHPFPAAVEDCYAALVWAAAHAAGLGIDPARLAVGGESAGGGLSAAVALMARDCGGPALRLQYLGIPELDDTLTTVSMAQYVDTPRWNRPNAVLSWQLYLADLAESDEVSPYAAPARAEDLRGLPPAVITACEFDPLRDEDIAYAQRLVQAGVHVDFTLYAGAFHGAAMIPGASLSRRIVADKIATMRRWLVD